jgi:hypothetical protein
MPYIRDKKTNVVINSDIGQYKTILAMRKKNKENVNLRQEVNMLKHRVALIEQALGMTKDG